MFKDYRKVDTDHILHLLNNVVKTTVHKQDAMSHSVVSSLDDIILHKTPMMGRIDYDDNEEGLCHHRMMVREGLCHHRMMVREKLVEYETYRHLRLMYTIDSLHAKYSDQIKVLSGGKQMDPAAMIANKVFVSHVGDNPTLRIDSEKHFDHIVTSNGSLVAGAIQIPTVYYQQLNLLLSTFITDADIVQRSC